MVVDESAQATRNACDGQQGPQTLCGEAHSRIAEELRCFARRKRLPSKTLFSSPTIRG